VTCQFFGDSQHTKISLMSESFTFETQHQDMIHDAQMDYYGKRLATCSSDKVIKIFDILNNQSNFVTDLVGHEAAVWAVAWAHPKFGTKLASASYDRKVIIWTEERGVWSILHVYSGSELSVNAISWAPYEQGLVLVCGSSDGTVSILSQNSSNEWATPIKFKAHEFGVSAVNWAPASLPLSLVNVTSNSSQSATPRFVSAGCDNLVKIWNLDQSGSWQLETTLEGHKDWVRDVAWYPNVGLHYSTIASCYQDGVVFIWVQTSGTNEWIKHEIKDTKFESVVWRVSWSLTGNILAISSGDNVVTLWKENLEHQWKCISSLSESDS
jgi:protein transport protein SEC13